MGDYARTHDNVFALWLLAPPALAVISVGLLLFPMDVDALQRKHGVDRVQKWAQLPTAWRAIMVLAFAAAFANRYWFTGRLI
jgi:hypothetical protein